MDKLERRIIQLKIEREAVKKEKDEASIKRFGLIEDEIARLDKEYPTWKKSGRPRRPRSRVRPHQGRNRQGQGPDGRTQRRGQYDKLAELQYGNGCRNSEAQLKRPRRPATAGQKNKLLRTQVGAEEIAEVVSRATGIPVSKMMQGERDKLLKMEERLHQRVSARTRRCAGGRRHPPFPRRSVRPQPALRLFLFLGPTGVGKTELCKAPGRILFDSEEHLIRIDMSEFMESTRWPALIGAPPGYVGYEEGGYLTEAVRRKPYWPQCHPPRRSGEGPPDVFNVLLQVLDDGRMTDGQGRTSTSRTPWW